MRSARSSLVDSRPGILGKVHHFGGNVSLLNKFKQRLCLMRYSGGSRVKVDYQIVLIESELNTIQALSTRSALEASRVVVSIQSRENLNRGVMTAVYSNQNKQLTEDTNHVLNRLLALRAAGHLLLHAVEVVLLAVESTIAHVELLLPAI